MTHSAVNWNKMDDTYTQTFWNQNVQQFWLDADFPVSDDQIVWVNMTPQQKHVFSHTLGGLTLLDKEQSTVGMPVISLLIGGDQRKAVLNFMGAMEGVHAKSYSSIFTTLLSNEEIDEVFNWVETNPYLQVKADVITSYYNDALKAYVLKEKSYNVKRYMAMVLSVFLETYLFYSGFYYPLYLSGIGKMTSSGEVIGLIIRDESIHGLYVGTLAQEIFLQLTPGEVEFVQGEITKVLTLLHENEEAYTRDLYAPLGDEVVEDVITFIKYNADKALMNLGIEPYFNVEASDINPIVLNGLNTAAIAHDFFSVRGNSYVLSLNVQKITDEHFVFEIVNEFGDEQ